VDGTYRRLHERIERRAGNGQGATRNIKVRAETIAQFTGMADEYGLVFGELLQHAIDALKRERGRG
jgi:hypothetical protein